MQLYLVRHGVAVSREDPACPAEPDRPLTPKGVTKTRAVALGLGELGVRPQAFLTSPYLRAVQTAEIFCEALEFPVTRLRRTDALMPESKPALLFPELAHLRADEVICFGHAPNLDRVIGYAAGRGAPFTALKKAGVALLELDSVEPPKGMLVWLCNSRILRRLGE
jgi:phosphohistidine phosphatase